MLPNSGPQRFTLVCKAFCFVACIAVYSRGGETKAAPPKKSITQSNLSQPPSSDPLGVTEYKKSKAVDVYTSQSRLFQVENSIVRTSVGDPFIAQPVVLCRDQFVIIGRKPGATTFGMWDDAGHVMCMNVVVRNTIGQVPSTVISAIKASGRNISSGSSDSCVHGAFGLKTVELKETQVTREIENQIMGSHSLNGLLSSLSSASNNKSSSVNALKDGYLLNVEHLPEGGIHLGVGSTEDFHAALATGPKNTILVDIAVAETRIFKTRNPIVEVVVQNPAVAEPVVVSDTEIVMLGKLSGKTTVVVRDDHNNSDAFAINCVPPQVQKTGTHDAPARMMPLGSLPRLVALSSAESIKLSEQTIDRVVELNLKHVKCFSTNTEITRASMTDPLIAELVMKESRQLFLVGKSGGETTLFLWDVAGNRTGIKLRVSTAQLEGTEATTEAGVTKESKPAERTDESSGKGNGHFLEVEYWTGSRKDILVVPRG